jgi:putative ABC transport system permease protein
MSLALATLIYEWRRYLAAVMALAMSGALVLVMQGLFTGIVHTVLATTERSRADIFIMPVKTATMVNSNPSLPDRVEPLIFLNPHVTEVRSFEGGFGQWVNVPRPGEKQVQKFVNVWSVDPIPGAVTLPVDYTEQQRVALMEPGAVALDQSVLKTLGVGLGDKASFDGHTVWVRAILHNYQDVDQTDIVMSRDTTRLVGAGARAGSTGPLMVRIDDPAQAQPVSDELNAISHGAYHAWTRAQFSLANERAVLSEQIVGVLLVFLNIMAVVIGIGITSQTLRSAIASNIREFASLRALGISMGSLRLIVVELSLWAGVAGMFAAALLTWLATLAAGGAGLPLVLRTGPAIFVCIMQMVIAAVSGALAMGVLKQSQPADLLR